MKKELTAKQRVILRYGQNTRFIKGNSSNLRRIAMNLAPFQQGAICDIEDQLLYANKANYEKELREITNG